MKIARATAEDYPELMDLMVRCFRIDRPDHPRFEIMYPDLYRPTDESMSCHRIIRDRSRIVASIGIYPLDVRVDSVTLHVGGVGGVCTHPDARGRGCMTALMTQIVADLKEEGYALSWLTGSRQRYRRFGWETAGTTLRLLLAHAEDVGEPTSEVQRVQQPVDGALLKQVAEARSGLKVRGLCDDEALAKKFQRVNVSLTCVGAGSTFAYLAVNETTNQAVEWGGAAEGVQDLLRHFCSAESQRSVSIPPVHDEYSQLFLSMADGGGPIHGNIAVLDLAGVMQGYKPFLTARWPKGRTLKLCREGVEVEAVSIREGEVVSECGDSSHTLTVDEHTCTRLLFGPYAPSLLLGTEWVWLDTVFPLPFYVPYMWYV